MTRVSIAIATVLLCLGVRPPASALTLQASVDKSEITVGDLVTYTLTIRHTEDEHIIRTPETTELFGPFEVRQFRTIPTKRTKQGALEERAEYLLTAYETGDRQIPAASVVFVTSSGDTNQVRSQEMTIRVESVLAQLGADPQHLGEADIKDIKPPSAIKGRGLGWLVWAGAIGLVALAMGSYVWYKHRLELWRRRVTRIEKPVNELAEFDKIAIRDLLQKREYKTLHILLSEALRRYIERRWDIDAMERTTYEIVEMLRNHDVRSDHVAMVQDYLDDCDLVKFAKYVPPLETMQGMVERAKEIVRNTQRFVALPPEESVSEAAVGVQSVHAPEAEPGDPA